MRVKNFILFASILYCQFSIASSDCIAIANPESTDSSSKFEIHNSGHYCLVENLHSRFDFADHSAESKLIHIWTSDVVIDLQQHVLGRGTFIKNPGGVGVEIEENVKNITIKNGTFQDFNVAVYRGVVTRGGGKKINLKPTFDPKTKTYRFERDNIVISNVRFIHNKTDMQIEEKE